MRDNSWFYLLLEVLDEHDKLSLMDLMRLWQEKENMEAEEAETAADEALTDEEKVQFLLENDERMWGEEEPVPSAEEKTEFKQILEEMVLKQNPDAMRILAYHYYGGSPLYPCDWQRSQALLLKTFECTHEPFLANTLGYIYYYGRGNNGLAEYSEAFRYFSFAAAHGVIEAQYKLADMYAKGQGTWQSGEAAALIIHRLYSELLDDFCQGEGLKFADVALRMGRLYEAGCGVETSPYQAYAYYLQADYALKRRQQLGKAYGDGKVAENIRAALKRLVPPPQPAIKNEAVFGALLQLLLQQVPALTIHSKYKKKKGLWKLNLTPAKALDEEARQFLLTVPHEQYCALADEITVQVRLERKVKFPKQINVTQVVQQENGEIALYDVDSRQSILPMGSYILRLPERRKKSKKIRIAQVTFDKGGKKYDYFCGKLKVKKGDWVQVDGAGAGSPRYVADVFTCRQSELKLPLERYCKIVKIVNK